MALTDSDDDSKPEKKERTKITKRNAVSSGTNMDAAKVANKSSTKAKSSIVKQDPGRPTNDVLDQLLEPIGDHRGVAASARRWKCVGKGCGVLWKGRTIGRVLKHAAQCQKVTEAERVLANKNLSGNAVGAIVEALDKQAEAKRQPIMPEGSSVGGSTPVNEFTSRDYFSAAGHKEHGLRITLCIIKLFCAAGIPPYVLETEEWKEFLNTAVPYFHAFSREYFENKLIPQEAALVRDKQDEQLKKESKLTLTFDGGETRGSEAFYTMLSLHPIA